MAIRMFKLPGHRVFNYTPRYYAPEKEKRDKIEDTPEARIKGSMRKTNNHYRNELRKMKIIRTLIIVVVLIFGIVFFETFLSMLTFF